MNLLGALIGSDALHLLIFHDAHGLPKGGHFPQPWASLQSDKVSPDGNQPHPHSRSSVSDLGRCLGLALSFVFNNYPLSHVDMAPDRGSLQDLLELVGGRAWPIHSIANQVVSSLASPGLWTVIFGSTTFCTPKTYLNPKTTQKKKSHQSRTIIWVDNNPCLSWTFAGPGRLVGPTNTLNNAID